MANTTTPADADAQFEAALERAAKEKGYVDVEGMWYEGAHQEKTAFRAGARWGRAWVLANDPVVRAMAEELESMRAHMIDRGEPDDSQGMIDAANALAAYRESVSVKEGG